MVEFKRCFDLLGHINEFITKRRRSFDLSESREISPHVLSQEKDGVILYSWNDFSPSDKKTGSIVTHIGLFDPATQENKVLWINNQKIKVVSCSVNRQRTLLAYTTVSKESSTDKTETYNGFLAELQASDTRVFSLNLTRKNYLKVQFLYNNSAPLSTSHLLVFLHKESIGLYKIPLGRAGDQGTVMSNHPVTSQLVRKFVWCQWDALNQCLHYIHNYQSAPSDLSPAKQKLSSIQFHQNGTHDNMLDIPLNFPFPYIKSTSKSHYADRPLNTGIPDVSINARVLNQTNGTFCLCYQHMAVTSKKGRTSPGAALEEDDSAHYYICMVHHTKTIHGCVPNLPKTLIGSRRLSFHWLGDYLMVLLPGFFVHLLNVGIEFEPCHHILLHNEDTGHVLKPVSLKPSESDVEVDPDDEAASVSETEYSDASRDDGKPHTVRFKLVDTVQEIQDRRMSDPSVSSSDTAHDVLEVMSVTSTLCRNIHSVSPCSGFTREIGGTLYDYRNGHVWKIVMSVDTLADSFRMAYTHTRQAILHYLLTRTRELYTVRKVFGEICLNLTRSELSQALAEYIVASRYNSMKRQLEKDITRLLPFTAVDTFRGQFEKSLTGERLARLSFTTVESINITTKTARERQGQRSAKEDMWDILRRLLRLKQLSQSPRFNHDVIRGEFNKRVLEEERDKLRWDISSKKKDDTSFLGIHNSRPGRATPQLPSEGASGRGSRNEMILGPAPLFLQGAYGEDETTARKLNALTEECLTSFLAKHLKRDKVKAQNIAKEYVSCQTQKVRLLCHMLWSLCQMDCEEREESFPNLCEPGSDEDYELFQLYERLYLTLSELCIPPPPGFQTFITSLGFRCLDFRLFLQYVDKGVLSLTGQFVSDLLADVPDDDQQGKNCQIKYQIISRLPRKLAEECFCVWNHPICKRYFAHQQVTEILCQGTGSSSKHTGTQRVRVNSALRDMDSLTSSSSTSGQTFAPLAAFIHHVEETAKDNTKHRPWSKHGGLKEVDTVLLEDVGLQNTRACTKFDMSTANF